MRKIKFRAWDSSQKKMIENHEPFLWNVIMPGISCGNDKYKECVVMQFTGLKDCNGKEIYEGDIVKFTIWWFGETSLIGEIVYSEQSISFQLKGVKNAEWEDRTFTEADFEIIGNIHENPEFNKELVIKAIQYCEKPKDRMNRLLKYIVSEVFSLSLDDAVVLCVTFGFNPEKVIQADPDWSMD